MQENCIIVWFEIQAQGDTIFMRTKEELINSLVIRLADSSNISVRELKNAIAGELYEYSVSKIECTM